MKDAILEVPTPDGPMDIFVAYPEQDGPFPPIILYMDFWGMREELYDLARMVASVGYYCVVPDLYHRKGKRLAREWRNEKGEMISYIKLDEATQKIAVEPQQGWTDEQAMRDTAALFAFFDSRPDMVQAGGVGCFGYCMGGRLALRAAALFPQRIKAAASMHGTNLASDEPTSPHLGASKITGELYFGFAEHDPWASIPMIKRLEEELKKNKVKFAHAIHKGALHGYALPQRDIFHKQGYFRDWEMIFAMFNRQIPAYSKE